MDHSIRDAKKHEDLSNKFDSLQDERMLLSLLIYQFQNEVFFRVCDIVSDDCFIDGKNRITFHVIKSLAKNPENINELGLSIVDIQKELEKFQEFQGKGSSYYYITSLQDDKFCNGKSIDAVKYAQRIKTFYENRLILNILEKNSQLFKKSQTLESPDFLNKLSSEIKEVQETISSSKKHSEKFQEHAIDDLKEIQKFQDDPDNSKEDVIPTGYTKIDELLAGGMRPTDLVIIGARPGIGKTALALNIMEHIMRNQAIEEPPLFISLEMPWKQISYRFISSVFSIDHEKILNKTLDFEEYSKLTEMWPEIEKTFAYGFDAKNLTPLDIRSEALYRKRHGGLSVLFIDYLQYINMPGCRTRYEEVSKITRDLKAIADDLNIPVVALAQLNRNSENRKNTRPVLADLKESGEIEQTANIIMFIHRNDDQNDQQAEILVKKNRSGLRGDVLLTYNGQYCRFDN